MAVTSDKFYICLPDLNSVQVHNFQGALLYSFGDEQTLFCPVSICVNSDGDTFVAHKGSERDPTYKVTSWSAEGDHQRVVLCWNKTKAPPAIACQGHMITMGRNNMVALYQLVC